MMDAIQIGDALGWLPLVLSVAAFVLHVLAHRFLELAGMRSGQDQVVWAAVSVGIAVGWTWVLWDVMPLGVIGAGVLADLERSSQLIVMYVAGQASILPYQLVTSFLHSDAPFTRCLRKAIPTVVCAYVVVSTPSRPSTPLIAISWCIAQMYYDTMFDLIVMIRCAGVWSPRARHVVATVSVLSMVSLFVREVVGVGVFAVSDAPAAKVAFVVMAASVLAFELAPDVVIRGRSQ